MPAIGPTHNQIKFINHGLTVFMKSFTDLNAEELRVDPQLYRLHADSIGFRLYCSTHFRSGVCSVTGPQVAYRRLNGFDHNAAGKQARKNEQARTLGPGSPLISMS